MKRPTSSKKYYQPASNLLPTHLNGGGGNCFDPSLSPQQYKNDKSSRPLSSVDKKWILLLLITVVIFPVWNNIISNPPVAIEYSTNIKYPPRPDKWKRMGYYEIRKHLKCKSYANDIKKPLPTLSEWNDLRRKYKEFVGVEFGKNFDEDPIQPTEGYTLTTEKAGLLRGVPVPPPYYADHGKRGRGLFAKRDIKKGELVHDGTDSDVVFPDALSWRQLVFSLQREMACSLVDWSWTQSTSENGELELFSAPNISVLLNGSSGKTVNINPKTGYSSKFYALRDIKKGEELVTDYDVYETNWKAVGL